MKSEQNPYASPQAGGQSHDTTNEEVEVQLVAEVDQTRPWMLGLAISLFVICGHVVLNIIALLMLTGGAVHSAIVAAGFVGGVFALLFLVAGMILLNVRLLMGRFVASRRSYSLEKVVRAQNGFWMLAGCTSAVIAALYLIIFIWGLSMNGV